MTSTIDHSQLGIEWRISGGVNRANGVNLSTYLISASLNILFPLSLRFSCGSFLFQDSYQSNFTNVVSIIILPFSFVCCRTCFVECCPIPSSIGTILIRVSDESDPCNMHEDSDYAHHER